MLAICFAVTVWVWWGACGPPDGHRRRERLSLERCIEIAIANQPAIHQQHSTLDMNEAALGMARSDYYPQLDLTAGLRATTG
jgi:outer membrane protein TolC